MLLLLLLMRSLAVRLLSLAAFHQVMCAEALLGNPALFASLGESGSVAGAISTGNARSAGSVPVRDKDSGNAASCPCLRRGWRAQRERHVRRQHGHGCGLHAPPTACELAAEYLELCALHPPADFLKVRHLHACLLLPVLLPTPGLGIPHSPPLSFRLPF